MFQPDSSLPEVPLRPAPWNAKGRAWVVSLALPPGSKARDAFLIPDFAGKCTGRAVLAFVDYESTDCGPYHELLFIPGTVPFSDGKRHMTISRIVVSTWDSVVNGRINWGIPKDRADFDVEYGENGTREDHVVVRDGERVMADLRFKASRIPLPAPGSFTPESARLVGQRKEGTDYFYAMTMNGWANPGKVVSFRFDSELFPDVSAAKVEAAMKLRFWMKAPVARTRRVGPEK